MLVYMIYVQNHNISTLNANKVSSKLNNGTTDTCILYNCIRSHFSSVNYNNVSLTQKYN